MDPEGRHRDEGLQIEPVRVAPRRSPVPAAIVAIAAVAFVVLVVAKPWDSGRSAAASKSAAISSTGPATPATSPPITSAPPREAAATPFAHSPTPPDLVEATIRRSEWGIRAVVVPSGALPAGDGTGSGLVERFLAIDVSHGAAWDVMARGTAVEAGDDVVALGVTTPDDAMPLDIRFWRLESGGVVRRITPRPVPGREAGSWLWLPDPKGATTLGTWPAGTYQIDVLLGPRIVRLVTVVPTGVAAQTSERLGPGQPDILEQLTSFGPGPFATSRRGSTAIAALPQEALDERVAWLGPATGRLEIAAVGQVAQDGVIGIGVLLEPGSTLVSIDLEQVTPAAATPDLLGLGLPAQRGLVGFGELLEYRDLRPFESGLYHLTAVSKPESGPDRTQTWNVEIVPSTPPTPPGMPLVRMARWVPLMADPARLGGEPLIADQGAGDGTCGGSAHISTSDELFGIIEPRGREVSRIRLFTIAGRFQPDIVARIAPNAVEGLTLVAVPSGGLLAGEYQLDIDTTSSEGPERHVHTICVGPP